MSNVSQCPVPRSHKLGPEIERATIIAAALADPARLVHIMAAPAGSTLLFSEARWPRGGAAIPTRPCTFR